MMNKTTTTEQLNEMQQDVLREIGNIGSGNAITTLSQMIGDKIECFPPQCRIVDKDNFDQLFEDPLVTYAGISMETEGDMQWVIMLLLKKEFINMILQCVTGEEVTDIQSMSEDQKSAACELGNIMCNSYITALATLMNTSMDVSLPQIAIDTGEHVINDFMAHYYDDQKKLIFVSTTFYYKETALSSYIILHPRVGSIEDILNKLIG
jgi:chemotaxis protein CheC